MTLILMTWHIPDPDTQPEFYDDVPFKRAIAGVIDICLTLILGLLIVPFTAFAGVFFFPVLALTIGLIYRTACLSKSSATLGMRVMAIEILTLDGRRLDPAYAFWHSLTFTGFCVFPPLLALSALVMLTTPRHQNLGDLMLGTIAINRRAAM